MNMLLTGDGRGGLQIPPRGSWDILSSAGNACLSLLDQKSRDDFLATLNKGTINPPVLAQAELGFAMILALHNDLNSPLFRQHGFDIDEFAVGVGPALERYHDVRARLEDQYVSDMHQMAEEEEEKEENGLSSQKESNGTTDLKEGNLTSLKSPLLTGEIDLSRIAITHPKWSKKADEDPDRLGLSLESQLRNMLSPYFFEAIQLEIPRQHFFGGINLQSNHVDTGIKKGPTFKYFEGSTVIQDVALLSARAKEIIPKRTNEEIDETLSSDSSFDVGKQTQYPVVAQVEVLYHTTQKHIKKDTSSPSTDNRSDSKEMNKNSVAVAIFEGYLRGGPKQPNCLEWKLAMSRPAWEFGLHQIYTN
eukprot:CAMPEP_0184864906 /NCGR_PEP_ID=MMETSP0580-20130426/16279_1 /TAXON_ID=1118495 /ORGANISM="Dactyliosolen fragilissimus" /LENGTH=361 /DNA_ID=CAMNT_0027363855 /DNA_START=259 /DNA_END=1344 /DNA_ORIENTATION=+